MDQPDLSVGEGCQMPGFELNEQLVAASAAEIVAEMERVVLGGRDAAPAWALLIGDLVGSNLRQWDSGRHEPRPFGR